MSTRSPYGRVETCSHDRPPQRYAIRTAKLLSRPRSSIVARPAHRHGAGRSRRTCVEHARGGRATRATQRWCRLVMDKKPFVCKDSVRLRNTVVLRASDELPLSPEPSSFLKAEIPCQKFFCKIHPKSPNSVIAASLVHYATADRACISDTTIRAGASLRRSTRSWCSDRRVRGRRRRSSFPTSSLR